MTIRSIQWPVILSCPRLPVALKPSRSPERPPAGVGVEHGKVKPRGVAFAGESFGMGKEGSPVARALRPGAEEHQAKVGVSRFRKAVGKFGHSRKPLAQEEAKPVALRGIAVRRGVGEELLRLMFGVDPTFCPEQPIVGRLAVELCDQCGFGGKQLTDQHG